MTPEDRREKWREIISLMIKRNKARRIIESWKRSTGDPCSRCTAMKLTEEKFLISDITKHQRIKRAANKRVGQIPPTNTLGEQGLDFGPSEYNLGSLQELRSRAENCPFCGLAISSLREACESYVQENPEEDRAERGKQFNRVTAGMFCFASWQIDGRILVRDENGEIIPQKSKACTRRIRLRWGSDHLEALPNCPFPKIFDTYIVLMAPRTGGQGLFLGRPMENMKTDAALIRRWIDLCETSHGDFCRSKTREGPLSRSYFGVIDVQEMKLTRLPASARYIALSYTWGKVTPPFQTKTDNIRNLLVSGGLRKWMNDIPRTIRDAINLVVDLGERYLWVDSLCIIQDTDRSWALNSRVMDVVYGKAYLTICAADGNNSNAGLRGLHNSTSSGSTRYFPQNIAQYNREIRLMATQPAENFIKKSAWNTRGWTFQERLLSVRNVIFVAGRMYFQCRCTARSCDIITEHESAGWSIEFKDSPLLMLQRLTHHPLSVYKKSLELYMERNLTHPKDIIAAFTGIGNLVCEALGGSLVFGLPSSHFDWALLWEPRDAALRRPNEDKEEFPSWSWCGWKDEIMEYKEDIVAGCEDNLHDWLMYHTWITWYIRDGNGNLRLVWDSNAEDTANTTAESRWKGYVRPNDDEHTTYDKYGRAIKEWERDADKFPRSDGFQLVLKECPYDVDIIGNSDTGARNSTEKDMPFLQFFTWQACFRIREDLSSSFGHKFARYSIVDYKDDYCGTILLDKFWVRERDLEEPLTFIAISDAKQFSEEEYHDWANYIPLERQESDWDLYYVLLITCEDDISTRQGLGKVFKDAFDNSCMPEGKQWKEIILG